MKLHLTEKEEAVMRVFWSQEEPLRVRRVLELLPGEQQLHFNTVATFVRALEQKGYLAHISQGGNFSYYPVVSEDEYSRRALHSIMARYFNNSARGVVNALVHDGYMTDEEIKDLINLAGK